MLAKKHYVIYIKIRPIQRTFISIVYDITVNIGGQEFGSMKIGAYSQSHIGPGCNILFCLNYFPFAGNLFQHSSKYLVCFAVIDCCCKETIVGVRQFYIIGKLWLK